MLIPDFKGVERDLATVAEAQPHVVAHNIETVERLTPTVRDRRATYRQSLRVLRYLKDRPGEALHQELDHGRPRRDRRGAVRRPSATCAQAGVDVLTLGQYLQPSQYHLRVERFVPPADFDRYKQVAEGMGFLYVAAGPLVRSSYRAAEFFMKGLMEQGRHA